MKKNKFIIITLSLSLMVLLLSSCKEEQLGPSIFDTTSAERTKFDQWLLENYTNQYNIEFMYKFSDIESDIKYNLVPAELKKSENLAQIVKHVWLESYDEVVGLDFTRHYVPKQIQLIGSGAFDSDGTVVLGTAEGGLKVTLYYVNNLQLDPTYLNEYYFHVMHHEFAHILHQTKAYDPDFKKVTESTYVGNDWYLSTDAEAQKKGFITAYAQSETNEDFVETYSMYITHDQAWWNAALTNAGAASAALLSAKLEFVRTYFADKWSIDIDIMRTVVLRRGSEVGSMTYLNF